MKNKLSFCTVNILSDEIAEVIVNKGVEISLEMVEEYHQFLVDNFKDDFGVLVNKVHHFDYSFEAKLSIGSHANLKAIAVIDYTEKSKLITEDIAKIRKVDGWNLCTFSGLDIGWQQGLDWLKKELSSTSG